jgi:dTDP-4-amino-4,6-dideoxygalactose transaminase
MVLIEDCALALLSETAGGPLGSFGDYAVFCLYKTLPVPNGAVLVQNGATEKPLADVGLRPAGAPSTIARTAELFAQRARARAGLAGSAVMTLKRGLGWTASALDIRRETVGNIGFDMGQVDLAMSGMSQRLIGRLDMQQIRERRIENCQTLLAHLSSEVRRPLPPLEPGVCPLFLPILVTDKQAAVSALRTRGVEALEFWNESIEPGGYEMSPIARFLRRHVLELPVHQDLTPLHMTYMAECLSRLDLRISDASHRILAA